MTCPTCLEAWNYYHSQKATEAGRREQALCYESFIRTWSSEAAVGGIVWWEWDLSEGGDKDYNYTPKGKPAEKILRKWYADDRAATTALTPVATTQPALTGAGTGD